MDILEKAIAAEKGVGNLARALSVRQSTVSNWRYRKRLPASWRVALTALYAPAKGRRK